VSDITAEGENHNFSELLEHANVHLSHVDPYRQASISTADQSFRLWHIPGLHLKEVRCSSAQ
jgi:hypothetical protein